MVPKAEEDKAQNTQKESPNNELIRGTGDREGWKAMIADVCKRPGT